MVVDSEVAEGLAVVDLEVADSVVEDSEVVVLPLDLGVELAVLPLEGLDPLE